MGGVQKTQYTVEENVEAILRLASESHVRDQIEARLVSNERRAHDAVNKIDKHEEVCAMRYENISEKLSSLPTINMSIATLERLANRAIGIWLATTGFGVVLGIIVAIVKISGDK